MKKLTIFLCLCALLALTACGSNSSNAGGAPSGEPASNSTKGKIYDHKFGEPFYYNRTNTVTQATSKVALTISDFEIVKDRALDDSSDDNYDYIKVLVNAENIGDEISTDMAIRISTFQVYDANGKDISELVIIFNYLDGEFEPAELRPGGKNEGVMYIPFKEGAVPAELVYFDSVNKKAASTNQYVFKL